VGGGRGGGRVAGEVDGVNGGGGAGATQIVHPAALMLWSLCQRIVPFNGTETLTGPPVTPQNLVQPVAASKP
jgi:hypothetical protein